MDVVTPTPECELLGALGRIVAVVEIARNEGDQPLLGPSARRSKPRRQSPAGVESCLVDDLHHICDRRTSSKSTPPTNGGAVSTCRHHDLHLCVHDREADPNVTDGDPTSIT
jgi:hypothetical protein